MSCRAVIFDLYLTLLYDVPTGTRERAVEEVATAGISPAAWRRAWGSTLDASMRGAAESVLQRVEMALSSATREEADPALADRLAGLLLVRSYPQLYPDTRPALIDLRDREYRLALVSDISSEDRNWVHELSLDELFDAIVLSSTTGARKPESAMYQCAAEGIAVAPDECVYVGDGMSDELAGARRHGMCAVRMERGGYEYAWPPDDSFDYRVTNLRELLDWLPAKAGESLHGATRT